MVTTATGDPSPPGTPFPGILRTEGSGGLAICLGYLPIGLAFGVIAQRGGRSPFEIGLMSLLVFAGSSQFIALSMVGQAPVFPPS